MVAYFYGCVKIRPSKTAYFDKNVKIRCFRH